MVFGFWNAQKVRKIDIDREANRWEMRPELHQEN